MSMPHDNNGYGEGGTNTLLISLPYNFSFTAHFPKL